MSGGDIGADQVPEVLRLVDLKPYFKITILECLDNDVDGAFVALRQRLRQLADNRGRALAMRITGEVALSESDNDDPEDLTILRTAGFDRCYAITRQRDITIRRSVTGMWNDLTVIGCA